MLALLVVCLCLWALLLERYCYYYWQLPSIHRQLKIQLKQRFQLPYLWQQQGIRTKLLSQYQSQLQARLASIRLLIKLCPLLGLLGTVSGMIHVFDVIAITGNSDAKAMAAGIYRATVPTMAGLMLALSGLYFSYHLTAKAERAYQAIQRGSDGY